MRAGRLALAAGDGSGDDGLDAVLRSLVHQVSAKAAFLVEGQGSFLAAYDSSPATPTMLQPGVIDEHVAEEILSGRMALIGEDVVATSCSNVAILFVIKATASKQAIGDALLWAAKEIQARLPIEILNAPAIDVSVLRCLFDGL